MGISVRFGREGSRVTPQSHMRQQFVRKRAVEIPLSTMPFRCIIISSRSDEHLEVMLPSDTEDNDAAFLPSTYKEPVGDEELVMSSTWVSTKCPVTRQMMHRPMRNRHCGHCYDEDGIRQLISNRTKKAICPIPGCANKNVLVMSDMKFDSEFFDYIRKHSGTLSPPSSHTEGPRK